VDVGKSAREIAIEMLRRFPGAGSADIKRAVDISIERFDILEEERQERAHAFTERWYAGADQEVKDTVKMRMLEGMKLRPNAENLFPKPDKSKS